MGAGSDRSFPGPDEALAEQLDSGSERLGGGVDASLAAPGGETGRLIEPECEPMLDEEVLQGPGERTGRAARSACSFQRACGCGDSSSVSSRPTRVTKTLTRPMAMRSDAWAAKGTIHHGGSSRAEARFSAWLMARSGWRCQQRLQSPLLNRRVYRAHSAQGRGGLGSGLGREQVPHQPVCSRIRPKRPQRGQVCLATAASRRRRQCWHLVSVWRRTMPSQSMQVREQLTQRAVSARRRRTLPQRGHGLRRLASRSAARQR